MAIINWQWLLVLPIFLMDLPLGILIIIIIIIMIYKRKMDLLMGAITLSLIGGSFMLINSITLGLSIIYSAAYRNIFRIIDVIFISIYAVSGILIIIGGFMMSTKSIKNIKIGSMLTLVFSIIAISARSVHFIGPIISPVLSLIGGILVLTYEPVRAPPPI